MKTALLFSFSDIGKNERMLRYSKHLVTKKNMKVILVGYDISDIPKKIKKLPNLSIRYIFPFLYKRYFLQTLLWPFQFIYYLIQMIGIAVNISSLNLVISTTTFYFIETICGIIVSKIHHSILIYDISIFSWYDHQITSFITKKLFSYGNFLICPTHSIEVVLKLAGFRPFMIPNAPDSDLNFVTEKVRNKLFNFLNVDENSFFITVPISEFDHDKIDALENAANYLKRYRKPITFIVFGSGKLQEKFKDNINKIKIKNIDLKFFPFQYDIYPSVLSAFDIGIYFPESEFVLEISPRLLEMAASGIPIIAFRFGCVNEIVKENVNGIVLNNINELGSKLKEIIINKSVDLQSLRRSSALEDMNHKADELWDQAFDEILSK